VFPNLSISGVLGDPLHGEPDLSGLEHRADDHTAVRAGREGAVTAEAKAATATFSEMVLRAVRDEDYAINFKIQAGLRSGANKEFTLGATSRRCSTITSGSRSSRRPARRCHRPP
jgi:hypothetical protein